MASLPSQNVTHTVVQLKLFDHQLAQDVPLKIILYLRHVAIAPEIF
jgi:hypothetical protein